MNPIRSIGRVAVVGAPVRSNQHCGHPHHVDHVHGPADPHGFDLGFHVANLASIDPIGDGDIFQVFVDGTELLQVGLGFGTSGGYFDPIVSDYEVGDVDSDEGYGVGNLRQSRGRARTRHTRSVWRGGAFTRVDAS